MTAFALTKTHIWTKPLNYEFIGSDQGESDDVKLKQYIVRPGGETTGRPLPCLRDTCCYLSSELRTSREIARVPEGRYPQRQISHGLTKASSARLRVQIVVMILLLLDAGPLPSHPTGYKIRDLGRQCSHLACSNPLVSCALSGEQNINN
ncbi:hypothetical protein J6590_021475 [Homalodisca vitripennis]|nr:hypothetical protein J6590_021475 [Homalodisca vitripennis]